MRAGHPGPDPAVEGDELDPVPGARGQRGEQQRGLDLGVQARGVLDPGGRRARRVEHEQDAPVPLGAPRAHDDLRAARGRAPVDRPDVVADDVLAQRVELGALAADLHGGAAVHLPQPGQPRRQVAAGGELRQHPQPSGHRERRLPGREPERADDADRHRVRQPVAAAGRHERGDHPAGLARAAGRRRAGSPRRPRTAATRRARAPAAAAGCRCVSVSTDRVRSVSRTDGRQRPGDGDLRAARRRGRRRPRTATTTSSAHSTTVPGHRHEQHGHDARRRQHDGAPGQRHVAPCPVAVGAAGVSGGPARRPARCPGRSRP